MSTSVNTKQKKKRIVYLDYLRALAIITVILFHIFRRIGYVAYPEYALFPSLNWWVAEFLGTCCRCGVDIFLMLSGALSLGRVWDIRSFLGKRIPRIVMPFLFWGFVLSVLVTLIVIFYPPSVAIFKAYSFRIIKGMDILSFLRFLGDAYMANNKWFGPYWFFWMILGTYLIMPIFNKWIYNSSLREVEYFLAFWLITCIFDYTLFIQFPIKLTYFSGPIGMVVLGYYLRHTDREIFNSLRNSIILLVGSIVIFMLACYLVSTPAKIVMFDRYSIFLALEVAGIYLVYKNIDKKNINIFQKEDGFLRRSSFSIAKYSYGIYLIHQVIMNFLIIIFLHMLPYKVTMLVLFVGTLGISWLVMALLNRVPYINRVIGAK